MRVQHFYKSPAIEAYGHCLDEGASCAEKLISCHLFDIFEARCATFFVTKDTLWLRIILMEWQLGVKACLEVSRF